MPPLFLLGCLAGVAFATFQTRFSKPSQNSMEQESEDAARDLDQQDLADTANAAGVQTAGKQDTNRDKPSTSSKPPARAVILTISLAGLCGSILWHVLKPRKQGQKKPQQATRKGGVSIPLKEVVRFKERQWFVEDLDHARDGDGNAMLRLAKMYLHGQGCEKNVAMAQEWLRRARYVGLVCTLDELYADNPRDTQLSYPPAKKQR